MSVLPVQWHALCFGLFASIIAPFGGFFASGFKRAFNIKVTCHLQYLVKHYSFNGITVVKILVLKFQDFGYSIPGHGGFTDRMDCQVMCVTVMQKVLFQTSKYS